MTTKNFYISYFDKKGQFENIGKITQNDNELIFEFNENTKKYFHGNFSKEDYIKGYSNDSFKIIKNFEKLYNLEIHQDNLLKSIKYNIGGNAPFFLHKELNYKEKSIFKNIDNVFSLSEKESVLNLIGKKAIIVESNGVGKFYNIKSLSVNSNELDDLYLNYLIGKELKQEFHGPDVKFIKNDSHVFLLEEKTERASFSMKKIKKSGNLGFDCSPSIRYSNINLNIDQLFYYITANPVPKLLEDNKVLGANILQDMYLKSLSKLYHTDLSSQSSNNAYSITQSYIGNVMMGQFGLSGDNINFQLKNDDLFENHLNLLTNNNLLLKPAQSLSFGLINNIKRKPLNSLSVNDIIKEDPSSKLILSRRHSGDIIGRCKKIQKKIYNKAQKDYQVGNIDEKTLIYINEFFNSHIGLFLNKKLKSNSKKRIKTKINQGQY